MEVEGSCALREAAREVLSDVVLTDVDGATRAITRDPRVSVVIVDDAGGAGAHGLVETIGALEPSVPIVLVGSTAPAARIALSEPPGAATLRAVILDLVEVRTYGRALVSVLERAATSTLEEGFASPAEVRGSFLKTNRRHLARVNSLLSFGGRDVTGWACVSAEAPTLRAILGRMFPGGGLTTGALEDLAGEIANHVVGRLRLRLPPSRIGPEVVPQHLRGTDAGMRAARAKHSVVAELALEGGDAVFVQLHVDAAPPVPVDETIEERAGTFQLL